MASGRSKHTNIGRQPDYPPESKRTGVERVIRDFQMPDNNEASPGAVERYARYVKQENKRGY